MLVKQFGVSEEHVANLKRQLALVEDLLAEHQKKKSEALSLKLPFAKTPFSDAATFPVTLEVEYVSGPDMWEKWTSRAESAVKNTNRMAQEEM